LKAVAIPAATFMLLSGPACPARADAQGEGRTDSVGQQLVPSACRPRMPGVIAECGD
jgi:hypothetical protein